MLIKELTISHCRVINSAKLELSERLNLIIGDNGSGKTSIAEALSILSTGRSFRSNRIKEVLQYDASSLTVMAKILLADDEKQSFVGISKSANETKIRIDRQDVASQAELAKRIPITFIYPESLNLITGSPSLRRSYIDWIGFYLYPDYLSVWRKHQRALKQRNAALRNYSGSAHTVHQWTSLLIETQISLHVLRSKVIDALKPVIKSINQLVLPTSSVEISLESGLPANKDPSEISLTFYNDKLNQDIKFKRTEHGVHKSNLKIIFDDHPAQSNASRGQLKLIAIMLLLAQSKVIETVNNTKGIIVIDDVSSELDDKNKSILLSTLKDIPQQIIFTTPVYTDEFSAFNPKMFHVKHGEIEELSA